MLWTRSAALHGKRPSTERLLIARAKETRTKLKGQTLADHPTGAGPRSLLRVYPSLPAAGPMTL